MSLNYFILKIKKITAHSKISKKNTFISIHKPEPINEVITEEMKIASIPLIAFCLLIFKFFWILWFWK